MFKGIKKCSTVIRGSASLGARAQLALFITMLPVCVAAAEKTSPDLAIPRFATTDVIVQYAANPSTFDIAAARHAGAILKHHFSSINAAVFSVRPEQFAALAKNPNVRYISPDRPLKGTLEFAEPTVNANIAFQYGWGGANVGVAIIDSGMYAHSDFGDRIAYSESFLPNDPTTGDPYGHGTHVAGIVGGDGAASIGPNYVHTFRGIAPMASLINLRALDANGQGTDTSVINAIERAIQLKDEYNIRVINLSIGRLVYESYTLDPLCQEVEKAWQAGIVVVVAAGNNGRDNSMGTSGYSTITAPGNDPYVITVGCMNDMRTYSRRDDLITSYSSKGPTLLDQVVKPDIVAPGNGIISAESPGSSLANSSTAVPYGYYIRGGGTTISTDYIKLSGTSMATPMVSGAAADLLQQRSYLSPDQVKSILMKTATKKFPSTSVSTDPVSGTTYTNTYDLFTIGAGYLDVWGALNNYDYGSGQALSPTATFDPNAGTVSVILAPGSVWTNTVVWGTTVVWGSNVIVNGQAVVWGTAVVWGSTNSSAQTVVWGTTVVWGSDNPNPQTVSTFGDM